MTGRQQDKLQNILRDILTENKSLLNSRDALISRLDEAVPGSMVRDFNPLRAALAANVGEIFLVADGGGEDEHCAARQKAMQLLLARNMQEKRIHDVIDTFVYALRWDESMASAAVCDMDVADAVPLDEGISALPQEAWLCTCGKQNTGNFCTVCGLSREDVPAAGNAAAAGWICICGHENLSGKFCTSCGRARETMDSACQGPDEKLPWLCVCGQENIGKFCISCGIARRESRIQEVQMEINLIESRLHQLREELRELQAE